MRNHCLSDITKIHYMVILLHILQRVTYYNIYNILLTWCLHSWESCSTTLLLLVFALQFCRISLLVVALVLYHYCPNVHFDIFPPLSLSLSRSQCATVGRMQTAAAAGMKRRGCGSSGNASKWDRSGLQGGRQMMLLWIILSSSLSLMVDGQMKIAPETWVPQNQQQQRRQQQPIENKQLLLGEFILL